MVTSEDAPPSGPTGRALRAVREGFHRHDRSPLPTLDPRGAATVGAHVKLQLNLHFPMACAAYPGEETTWLAMGGQVGAILGPDRVRVDGLVSTTDRAPRAFEGEWIAELVRQPGANYPWMLANLRPAIGTSGFGAMDDRIILFKVACVGEPERIAKFLRELAAILGGTADDGSLVMSLPVRDWQAQFLVCATAGDLADSVAEQELLRVGADAILPATDAPALEVMKGVAKQLLSRVKVAR